MILESSNLDSLNDRSVVVDSNDERRRRDGAPKSIMEMKVRGRIQRMKCDGSRDPWPWLKVIVGWKRKAKGRSAYVCEVKWCVWSQPLYSGYRVFSFSLCFAYSIHLSSILPFAWHG
ncbi:hypothetical protein RIF29_15340 [Crotalaria pallida]|uniref:Uncharacterized protein n=1 Tax=Crotalaria pallida TaxID=3830 RepID=A0AAN9FCZ4_CROPI